MGSSQSPEQFRLMRDAFDAAWAAIGPGIPVHKATNAREQLAKTILLLSSQGISDVDMLAVSATQLFNREPSKVESTPTSRSG